MTVTIENAKKVPVNFFARLFYKSEKIEQIYISLNPGEKIENHKNPFDVTFFIIEGEGNLFIDNKKISLKKLSSVFIDSSKDRALINTGTKNLKLLVTKILKT